MATKIITIEEVEDGDSSGEIRLEGICTRSPDGSLWRVQVDDEGVISTEKIA